jgi:hypothetical protein
VTLDELSDALRAVAPDEGESLYIERRGEVYAWSQGMGLESSSTLPDAWISYTGKWPADDDEKWRALFADLIAELESMTGDADRCRWPLDDPWSHHH